MEIPFIGGAYTQRSPNINAQQSINLFPVLDNKEPKNVLSMYGTPGLKFNSSSAAYGDGTDGAVTISSNTTLTRDMKYTTLVVNNCITLNTAGFVISCTVSLTNNGTITDSSSGGEGGDGHDGAGMGEPGHAATKSGGGNGGDGGYGMGDSFSGGHGGKGGGLVIIYAKVLTNNGTIHADGFDGLAPELDAHGGNGGDGGTVVLYYETRTVGTVTANGGAGYPTSIVLGHDGAAGTTSWILMTYFAMSSVSFRGGIVVNDVLYAAVGADILKITTTGAVAKLGSITTTTGNVFMDSNGTQILIVDGTACGHYITLSSGLLSDITDADFPASSSCTFADGYFVVTKKDSGQFFISGLYDVTTWDALDFATAEGKPDNLVRAFYGNSNLWLFGTDTIEVWYNQGFSDFPFVRIHGSLIEDGLAGAAAVCMIQDQFYFLSNKREVLRTFGYQRQKVSTIHIDTEIQGYTTVSDAVMYEYRMDGHVFLVLTFPTADKTWVYDITTDYWHEWQSYKTVGVATYGRHRGAIGFFFGSKYVVGDHSNGHLYELSMTAYTDNGEAIKRVRRAQVINKERRNVEFHKLELDFEFGKGASPTATLCWSDDGTNTWSSSRTLSFGALSEYTKRAFQTRMGASRNRVYELTTYSTSKVVLLAAYADLEALDF